MEALHLMTGFTHSPLGVGLVYGLSFWHYGLYFLAYRYGRLEPRVFRRSAVALKTTALMALVIAYWPYALQPTWAALLVPALMAVGFGLNAQAARVLGVERTYYGHELMGLPYRKLTSFPYSLTSHPMLLGNLLAFAAPLLNPGFRADWWPVALAHVLANLGLLAMERWVTPLRLGHAGSRPLHPSGAR